MTRLSGIQPSGDLHLGNYFGAIRQHVADQEGAYYFIANYHAQTTSSDPEALRRSTLEAAATYLALGLDPERAVLFRQSDIPEVTELMWILMTVTNKGLLDRAVSYKDKVARGITPSLGLFTYPVLMAADILLYETKVVPVGSDQVQHVEMTRDMAQAFNRRFGEVFVVPEYALGTPTPVPGTDGQKMSKSYGNTIPLMAPPKQVRKTVMSIVTDDTPLNAPKDPETCTVFALYSLLTTQTERDEMASNYRAGGYGYGHAKLALINKLSEHFAAPRARYLELLARPDDLEKILQNGAAKARKTARRVIARARKASGL